MEKSAAAVARTTLTPAVIEEAGAQALANLSFVPSKNYFKKNSSVVYHDGAKMRNFVLLRFTEPLSKEKKI